MAALPSNWCHVFCIYVMLFDMFGTVHSKVTEFKLLSGQAVHGNAVDAEPHMCTDFLQCGRDQSCTHVIELSSGCVLVHGNIELEKRKYGAVRIYEKVRSQGKSDLLCYT